jgi:hypothetical protein
MSIKVKIKNLKVSQKLIGQVLPTNQSGHAGRAREKLLEAAGIPINRGAGPDILYYGVEVKTRETTATSAQTVTAMYAEDIINTPYELSPVYAKFQQQFRVKTTNGVIVEAEVYDFDQPHIQELVKEAYEHARAIIAKNPNIGYTPYTGYWGYFEQTKKLTSEAYDFRFSDAQMDALELMAKSTFSNLFEVS